MENPRAEKVAVVEEVRQRLDGAAGSVVTEYRGLTVAQLAELRRRLAAAGGDYKVYKNTLVRLAISSGPHEPLADYLTGPTAITFVQGDVSAVAKALREFARNNPALIVKGGLMAGATLSASDLTILADLPSRDVLLARLAGAIAAPMQTFAGLLQALPRNLAYGISALVEQLGGVPEAPAPVAAAQAPITADAVVDGDAAPEASAPPAVADTDPSSESAEPDPSSESPEPDGGLVAAEESATEVGETATDETTTDDTATNEAPGAES